MALVEVSPQVERHAPPAETSNLPPLSYAQILDLMVSAFRLEYLADVRKNMIGFDPKAYYGEPVEKVAA